MESCHSQESLPDFHFVPRTLQDIAASKYAFISWCNSSDLSHIPASIRTMIRDKIQSISKEIRIWNSFVGDILVPREVMINCVAFNPAGGICSRRTVKNLLIANLPGYDSKKQFEIACSYCIEEDIERLWPLVKDKKLFPENRFFDVMSYRLRYNIIVMEYWCSRMRGELKKFHGLEKKSHEWYVLSRLLSGEEFHVRNGTEIEYFWSKLNTQEKSSLVNKVWMMRNCTKYMIMKSNDTLLKNLVRSKWFLLIEHFATDDLHCQYALQLWNYGKSSIVKGVIFCQILQSLSNVAYKSDSKYATTILKEIWLSAPDHLKDYVCTLDQDGTVEGLIENSLEEAAMCIRPFGRDFGFLIELLKGVDFEIRQRMWFNGWLRLTLLAKVSDLRELMTLCFDNVNDIVKFKKTEMLDYGWMRHHFEEFVRSELFEELSEYLMFCCSDADDEKQARIVRTKIIIGNMDWIIGLGHECDLTMSKFFQFFDGCFTLEEAAELLECQLPDKEAGLLSFWISFSCFKTFERLLHCLKFSDQRLMELKRFFKERCRHVLTFGNFCSLPVDDWDNFLKWCDFSPEELSELRCNIRMDNLFENFLINMYKFWLAWRKCRDSFIAVCFGNIGFNSIDGFLHWYFGSEQAVQEYKSRKRNDHENSEAIKLFLKGDKMVRVFFDTWFMQ